ncbi:hypothetical protein HCH52_02230 [Oscillospiraceae bacterium HV4-5-C5C]|nr:hypothetical protein [Oscillospiraceae bacterium HV4-5-C5C]
MSANSRNFWEQEPEPDRNWADRRPGPLRRGWDWLSQRWSGSGRGNRGRIRQSAELDPERLKQRRAGLNILRFFILMLILTLIARGTAGATMARVTLDSPVAAKLSQSIVVSGSVQAGASHGIKAQAAGLKIREVLALTGQSVQAGDSLLRYDVDPLEEKVAGLQLDLADLELELAKLQEPVTADDSGVRNAETALERVQEDYDKQAAVVTEAQDERWRKQVALDKAKATLAAAAPEEQPVLQYDVDQAQQAWDAADEALKAANEALSAQERSLADARTALSDAQTALEKSQQEAADQAAANQLAYERKDLDRLSKQTELDQLQAVLDTDGVVTADQAGTVLSLAEAGTETTEEQVVCLLTDATGGYRAVATLARSVTQKLKVGDRCLISAGSSYDYYGAEEQQGKIVYLSRPDDSDQVEVRISLPEGDWQQDQSVDLKIVREEREYPVCVPLGALHNDNNGDFVLMLQESTSVLGTQNTAVRVPVKVKAKNTELAAVEGSLSTWDSIIVSSTKPVAEGDRVRLAEVSSDDSTD